MTMPLVYEVGKIQLNPRSSGMVHSPPASPGTVFYPTGFLISGDTEEVSVTDIKVGRNSQFYAVGAVPASFFTQFAHQIDLKIDPVSGRDVVGVCLMNTGDKMATLEVKVVCGGKPPAAPLVVLGLGRTEFAGSLRLCIEPMMPVLPERLYVPGSLLSEIEINSVQCGPYLNVQEISEVPSRQLRKENLRKGGNIELDPYAIVGNGAYLTITTTNLSDKDLIFCGAVAARLLPGQPL